MAVMEYLNSLLEKYKLKRESIILNEKGTKK